MFTLTPALHYRDRYEGQLNEFLLENKNLKEQLTTLQVVWPANKSWSSNLNNSQEVEGQLAGAKEEVRGAHHYHFHICHYYHCYYQRSEEPKVWERSSTPSWPPHKPRRQALRPRCPGKTSPAAMFSFFRLFNIALSCRLAYVCKTGSLVNSFLNSKEFFPFDMRHFFPSLPPGCQRKYDEKEQQTNS